MQANAPLPLSLPPVPLPSRLHPLRNVSMGGGRRSCMGHLRSSSPVPLFASQVRLQSVHLPAFAALPCRGRAKVYISAGNHSTACVRSCDIVTTPVIRVLPCSCNNTGSYPNPPSYHPLRSGREGTLKKVKSKFDFCK